MKLNKFLYRLKYLIKNDEKGDVSQIFTFFGGIVILLFLVAFFVVTFQFALVSLELNDITDNLLSDSLKVNNGLTPSVQTYIENKLEEKGYELSKLTVSGTPATVQYGERVEGSIEYIYDFPYFRASSTIFPDIQYEPYVIKTHTETYARGIVR